MALTSERVAGQLERYEKRGLLPLFDDALEDEPQVLAAPEDGLTVAQPEHDRDTHRTGSGKRPPFLRRHRMAATIGAVIAAVLVVGGATFVYEWNHTGPQELSQSTALQHFRSGATVRVTDPGALHPAPGVYSYTGTASEHLTLPPKSQREGPLMPGTVMYQPDGCWSLRIDYSNSHWQSATYCPRRGDLVEVGRAGWYRWNFVAFSIADTATFTCQEMAVPTQMSAKELFAFACTGTNNPINTGTVTMVGTNEFMGPQTLHIAGASVPTLHFQEVARFGGGQSGTSVADTWFSTVNGLAVHGTWSDTVHSPSPVGTSTLTGTGSFTLAELTPRS